MNPLKLYTEVQVAPLAGQFGSGARIFAAGSCFATEIGERLAQSGFDITVNPFGTLYNPSSIAAALQRLAEPSPFTREEVIYSEPLGRYNSFWHHTKFARRSAEEFLADANDALQDAARAFARADVCIITLGTAWVFRHIATGRIVANCNKIPAGEFRRERMTVEECVACLSSMIGKNPDKAWILTVSPIRHMADGAHGNALSKATLLMATEQLEKSFPNVRYFPAFEIMTDELRDYRFYAEDLVHPSAQACEIIFHRFMEYAFSADAVATAEKARKEYRRSMHRPILKDAADTSGMA